MNEALLERITSNPQILAGKPTIRGLRISAEQVIKAVAAGITFDEIIADYPELEREDIRAALTYAAMLVEEQKFVSLRTAG